jgi:hypothetical protein
MTAWRTRPLASVGIRPLYGDPRAHDTERSHTVVIIDRIVRARDLEEMGRKLRQPVLAFASARHIDDGESQADTASVTEGERAVLAGTLESLRETILTPAFPPFNVYEQLKEHVDVLEQAVVALRQELERMPEERTAQDIAEVRVESDNVHAITESILTLLSSWELYQDERERPRNDPKER